MLETLHISNYALIDSIDIAFGPGLNVITGETGAGKSIILGALSLILGGRADTRVVRDKDVKSVIEAVFTVDGYPQLEKFCADNDIDWDNSADARLIMRREISPSGRSRAFINDTPVAVGKLQEVAIHLVDIHSQHQNLLLSRPEFQLSILDSLAGNAERLEAYQSRYTTLRDALRQLKRMKMAVEQSREDEEFMRYQLAQLDNLDPHEGEEEELEREREVIANITDIKEHTTGALAALSAADNAALDLICQARDHAEALGSLLSADDDIPGRLDTIRVELQDIIDTLASADSSLDADPGALDDIDDRLMQLKDMQRRHKVDSTEELVEIRNKLQRKLSLLDNGEEKIAELEKRARRAMHLARESAAELTEARVNQAAKLAQELRERALLLGMKNLQCAIEVTPADLSPTGADKVEFLFSFNKNAPLLPVGNTASGGEISRLMLSIKAIIAHHMQLPSLILDEIDTGVSGDVANRMGRLMADIADCSQVITITHLPQVAAKGDTHFKVYKEDDDSATHTHIRRLDADERIDELAIMLSGDPDNQAARANAIELMK